MEYESEESHFDQSDTENQFVKKTKSDSHMENKKLEPKNFTTNKILIFNVWVDLVLVKTIWL